MQSGASRNSQRILCFEACLDVTAHCSTTSTKLSLWKTPPGLDQKLRNAKFRREGILKSLTRMATVYAHKKAIVEA